MAPDIFEVHLLTLRSTLASATFEEVALLSKLFELSIGFLDLSKKFDICVLGEDKLELFDSSFKGRVVVPKNLTKQGRLS